METGVSGKIFTLPDHRQRRYERMIAGIARRIDFSQISVSHQVSPLIKLVARGDTTVVDAYLTPLLRRYVDRLASQLGADCGAARLMFMQSSGGLTDASLFRGRDAILSGPAGGVVGMVKTAAMSGYRRLIGFDMGGTSTDVSHYDGEHERSFETMVAGVRMRAPIMHIHTVAAGGGSILHFDGGRFRVGPDSAGADPGPACYRRGGPLTVTDCNVLLGRIQVEKFPKVFGPGGDEGLDRDVVRRLFEELARQIAGATGLPLQSSEQVAEGFLRIAIENMANAIKKISVQRGHDVTEYTLHCFGGAAGQHACRVADLLGLREIFLHPLAGVLSAYGMGLADIRAIREKQLELPFASPDLTALLAAAAEPLKAEACREVRDQGIAAEAIASHCKVHLRYAGTDTALAVDLAGPDSMRQDFERIHRQRFGFLPAGRSLVVESLTVEAVGATETTADAAFPLSNLPALPSEKVTVITPCFDESGTTVLFYLGSRGHHADIGGRTPGSSPPDSSRIEEEGIVIDDWLLVRQGVLREPETRNLLLSGPYPCSNVEQNMADLAAQIAANETGVRELRAMVGHFGLATVAAYMRHVQDNAEESVRRVLEVLQDGSFSYPMDNGSWIRVRIAVDRAARRAVIDFTGTSTQDPGNYNAPRAVCRAAVLYVFRTLVDDDIPLNAGCLKPLKIIIPEGSLLNPRYPAAVISGNTEVSQAVTDALYGPLGLLASSQGTMNNFLYGNERYQNYETICGGTGAGPGHHGTSAVHSHMTNTRMTDPEVLEMRFPVRVEEFAIRTGSGGRGKFRGGDGVVRRIGFLEAMTATILSSHRITEPYGLAGGGPGLRGRNRLLRADGQLVELNGNDEVAVRPGDTIVIETPGGGGYGAAGRS